MQFNLIYIFFCPVVTTMVCFLVVLPPIAAPYSSVSLQDQETNWLGSIVLVTLETSGTWHAERCKVLHLVYITTSQVLISLANFSSQNTNPYLFLISVWITMQQWFLGPVQRLPRSKDPRREHEDMFLWCRVWERHHQSTSTSWVNVCMSPLYSVD